VSSLGGKCDERADLNDRYSGGSGRVKLERTPGRAWLARAAAE
jgi:hypothetical protein